MKKNTFIFILFGFASLTFIGASLIYSTDVLAVGSQDGLIINQNTINSEAALLAAKFVKQVIILKSVSINTDVLKSPAFRALQDLSQPIPREDRGRINPFAPL